MELNILLLPLLGGYFVYLRFHGTAYYARQCSSQRLLFNSAIIGLSLLIAARATAVAVDRLNGVAITLAPLVGYAGAAIAVVTLLSLVNLGLQLVVSERERGELDLQFLLKAAAGLILAGVLAYTTTAYARAMGYSFAFASNAIGAAIVFTLGILCVAQWTRVHTRAPYESLLFRIALVALSFVLLLTIAIGYQPTWQAVWNEFSPYPQSGTALVALALGLLAVWPLNRLLFPHDVAIHRLYSGRRLNALDRLMYEAMLEESQIQFTLKEGKVYVGWVLSIPPQLHQTDTYIEILPVSSGYRQAATKRYVPTTFYDPVYAHYADNPDAADDESITVDDFKKIIPVSEILVAGKFKADAYLRFQEQGVAAPVDRG